MRTVGLVVLGLLIAVAAFAALISLDEPGGSPTPTAPSATPEAPAASDAPATR